MLKAYDQLKEMVDKGTLDVVTITAPARSSSTALERAVSNSPDVDMQINDPWALFDNAREEQTYEYILNKISTENKNEGEHLRVLIKNIADYIPPGDQWERYLALTRHNIFLIRNPLLTMDSLMRVMAKNLKGEDILLHSISMNEYARSRGYESWEDMVEKVNKSAAYGEYEEVYKRFFPHEQSIHNDPSFRRDVLAATSEKTVKSLGYESIDSYANAKGYSVWNELINAVDRNDITLDLFEDILIKVFQCRITGWDALYQHYQDAHKFGHTPIILDSTLYRCIPEDVLKKVLLKLNFSYSDNVTQWHNAKTFNTDYDGEIPYYQKVVESLNIALPAESPLSLSSFPVFIQEYLMEDGGIVDMYIELLDKSLSIFKEDEVIKALHTDINGKMLFEIDPVFSYCCLYVLQNKEQHLKNYLLKTYKSRFDDIFTHIDSYQNRNNVTNTNRTKNNPS